MTITPKEWLIMGIKSYLSEDDQCRIHVVSQIPSGETVSMGWIDKAILYSNPDMAKSMIGKIKYAPRINKRED